MSCAKLQVDIRCHGTDIGPGDELALRSLVAGLITRLHIGEHALRRLSVATDEEYGAAIAECDEAAAFTSDETAEGMGKTIPQREPGGAVVSSVVLRHCIVIAATHPDAPSDLAQLSRDVIAHELGHVKDNCLRGSLHVPRPVRPFRIHKVCDYYTDILVSEFAACAHAAPELDVVGFERDNEIAISLTSGWLNTLTNADHSDTLNLAWLASGVPWCILTEYSKLVGSRLGTSDLNDVALHYWPGCTRDMREAFRELRGVLATIWSAYPAIPTDQTAHLATIWHTFAVECGYQFVEMPNSEADALYW